MRKYPLSPHIAVEGAFSLGRPIATRCERICRLMWVMAASMLICVRAAADDLATNELQFNYGLLLDPANGANMANAQQDGSGNSATVRQSGRMNYLLASQEQASNAMNATQTGSHHIAVLTQTGAHNWIDLSQHGTTNAANVVQSGNYNRAYVEQAGSYNRAEVVQASYGLVAIIHQFGHQNFARVIQY